MSVLELKHQKKIQTYLAKRYEDLNYSKYKSTHLAFLRILGLCMLPSSPTQLQTSFSNHSLVCFPLWPITCMLPSPTTYLTTSTSNHSLACLPPDTSLTYMLPSLYWPSSVSWSSSPPGPPPCPPAPWCAAAWVSQCSFPVAVWSASKHFHLNTGDCKFCQISVSQIHQK